MNTNRRTFMQRCFAGVTGLYVAFVPSKAKSDVIFAPRKPKESLGGWKANSKPIIGPRKKKNPLFKGVDGRCTQVCYCHFTDRPGTICCNYPRCPDYKPSNEKPYKDEYE